MSHHIYVGYCSAAYEVRQKVRTHSIFNSKTPRVFIACKYVTLYVVADVKLSGPTPNDGSPRDAYCLILVLLLFEYAQAQLQEVYSPVLPRSATTDARTKLNLKVQCSYSAIRYTKEALLIRLFAFYNSTQLPPSTPKGDQSLIWLRHTFSFSSPSGVSPVLSRSTVDTLSSTFPDRGLKFPVQQPVPILPFKPTA